MPTVTKTVIIRELRRLGLRQGDIVMCHSALSSFGKVAGGARAVVDALLETIGREGTLLMPTLVGGNTNAPVIAIAEKAADLIRADR